MAAKPILYYAPRSPPSRSVLMIAKQLNLELHLKLTLNDKGENRTPEFLKMNPQHTIPVLNDNGTIVCDSHAIGAYLSEKYGKNDSLYPKDLGKRGVVDARLHFDSTFLFGRIRSLFEPILYDKCPELSADKIEYIQRSWPLMEAFLQDAPYVCGNELTIADLCCIASVSSIDTIATIDAGQFPKFIGWIERMKKLPYYDELNAPGAKQVQETILARVKDNKTLAEKQ